MDRDDNAARNILAAGLNTLGHREINASGDIASLPVGSGLLGKAASYKEESPYFSAVSMSKCGGFGQVKKFKRA